MPNIKENAIDIISKKQLLKVIFLYISFFYFFKKIYTKKIEMNIIFICLIIR